MPIEITYTMDLGGEEGVLSYPLTLDSKTLNLIQKAPHDTPPEWTRLECGQCSNCPLKPTEVSHCPIAVNLSGLAEFFKGELSTRRVKAEVKTEERTYSKETDLQDVLFSIFGAIMATSGCPVMDFLKPMARFHLPFATIEEHLTRSTSFYLLKQYFKHKRGENPDLDLKKLNEHYQEVRTVNSDFFKRIAQVAVKDADKNAMVILDAISQLLS